MLRIRRDSSTSTRQPLRRALLLHPGAGLSDQVKEEVKAELNVRELEDVETLPRGVARRRAHPLALHANGSPLPLDPARERLRVGAHDRGDAHRGGAAAPHGPARGACATPSTPPARPRAGAVRSAR